MYGVIAIVFIIAAHHGAEQKQTLEVHGIEGTRAQPNQQMAGSTDKVKVVRNIRILRNSGRDRQ